MTVTPLLTAVYDSAAVAVTRAQAAWLWTVEAAVAVTVALCLIVLLAAYLVLAIGLKKALDKLTTAVERFRQDVRPVTERAAAIADHLEHAAFSVRGAVDEVTDTIRTANETLRDAVATADERFRELDAIVQLARDEAEDVVVGAASTMRGVRGGLAAYRSRKPPPARARDEDVEDESPPVPPRRSGGPRIRKAPSAGEE